LIVAAWNKAKLKSNFHVDIVYFGVTRAMADSPTEEDWNVVSWALSGSYDEDKPVSRLLAR